MAVSLIKNPPFDQYQDLNFLLKQFRMNFWSVPVNNQDTALLTLMLKKMPGQEEVSAKEISESLLFSSLNKPSKSSDTRVVGARQNCSKI